MRQQRFCYRTPKFPEYAFIGGIQFTSKELLNGLFTIQNVYTSTAEFCADLLRLYETSFEKVRTYISEKAIIMPIYYKKSIPLTDIYWKQPTDRISLVDRQKLFHSAFIHYSMFSLLCTPIKFAKPFTTLSAALPFRNTTSEKAIEQFMLTSKFYVHPASNAAAIYSFLHPHAIEWKKEKRIYS